MSFSWTCLKEFEKYFVLLSAVFFLTWQEGSSLYNISDTAHLCRWTSCHSYNQPRWSESADRTSWSDGTTLSSINIILYFPWNCRFIFTCSVLNWPSGQCQNTSEPRLLSHRQTGKNKQNLWSAFFRFPSTLPSILVVVTECVPQSEADIHTVYCDSRVLQNLHS